ncbi:MAG: hypothetical protein Nkreftii_000063 [Candidatus Nitrospira kreftii]|uniref:Uncharacterized protein n=1 Tax=Candidatus Nitrospira kreftii TaxID=2652173 RepID=A0A7S8FAN0_9BACT|nr:MAG: hypothetical protein Nkreftii_000063 [Candidatus Nitrospira kreftii]
MLTRSDLSQGAYLRLKTPRLGKPVGLIGAVYALGTDQAGDWYFQLRFLNPPQGTRIRAGSQWSLNLHENDLEHFERIDTWDHVRQLLREPPPPKTPRSEEMKLPAYMRGNADLNQLRLFEDF